MYRIGKPPILIIILRLLVNISCHFQSFSNARRVGCADVSSIQKLEVFQYFSTTLTVIAIEVSPEATEWFQSSEVGIPQNIFILFVDALEIHKYCLHFRSSRAQWIV